MKADLTKMISRFDKEHANVRKDGKVVRLNNFYSTSFVEFDRNYVPFAEEFENG